jgi:hypothetical protein
MLFTSRTLYMSSFALLRSQVVQLLQHADSLEASATRDAYAHLEALLREEASLLIEQPEVCCTDGAPLQPVGSATNLGSAGGDNGGTAGAVPAVQTGQGTAVHQVHQGGVLWPALPPAVAAARTSGTAAAGASGGGSRGGTFGVTVPAVLPEEVVGEVAATWGGTLVSGTGQVSIDITDTHLEPAPVTLP